MEKCSEMQIVKQLKGNIVSVKILHSQRYDKNDRPQKFKKPFKTKYYLKRSKSWKPYLSKEKHVRKFDRNRDYKNKLSCFACSNIDHLVKDCTKRKNYHDKESILYRVKNIN